MSSAGCPPHTDAEQGECVKSNCTHDQTVIDESGGVYVCIQCGLVLDQLLLPTTDTHDVDNDTRETHLLPCDKGKVGTSLWFVNLCHNNHILPSFASAMFKQYTHATTRHIPYGRVKKDYLRAACVYYVLAINGAGKTMKEIASMCHISRIRTLSQYIKIHFPKSFDVHARDLMRRWCAYLNLPRTVTQKLCSGVSALVQSSQSAGWFRSSSVTVAGYLYVMSEQLHYTVPLSSIALVTRVSPPSIRAFKTMYKNFIIEK